MIDLIPPTTRLVHQWWDLVDEFGDEVVHGSGLHDTSNLRRDPARFAAWVQARVDAADPDTPLAPGKVPASYWWIRDEGRLVGTITLRHALTPALLLVGGHIGYAVRPSLRRRGIASAALRLVLAEAGHRGLDPVLVTCDDANEASARTIERAGGRLEDVRDGSRRYWVATGAGATPLDTEPLVTEPLHTEPIETVRATLAAFTRVEVGGILTGRHQPGWDPAFPREDDRDAVRVAQELDPFGTRGIRDRASGLVVGTIGCFGPPDRQGGVEVGYGLVERVRGSGLMTDVLTGYVRALLAAGVTDVIAHTEPGNLASERVLSRCGFGRVCREPGPDGHDQWLWRLGHQQSPAAGFGPGRDS